MSQTPGVGSLPPLQHQSSQLCKRCDGLNLHRLLDKADKELARSYNVIGYCMAEITLPQRDIQQVTCPACQLFHRAKTGQSESDSYELRGVPLYIACPSFSFGDLSRPTPGSRARASRAAITVIPKEAVASLGSLEKQVSIRQNSIYRLQHSLDDAICAYEVDGYADFSLLRGLVEYCQQNHAVCRRLPFTAGRDQLVGFKLIDVETGLAKVADLGESYVALSYVWGHNHARSASKWSAVVRDAMTATKKMGYQYLWVDQHCINQHSDTEKHHQISNMDLIYACADVTIIAAAGQDCDYGLQGISKPRQPSQAVNIGNLSLVTVPPDVYSNIKSSAWWSRGWTFQEGVLSRRRLFFTEGQVHYECADMCASESLRNPVGYSQAKTRIPFELLRRGILSGGVELIGAEFDDSHPRNSSFEAHQAAILKITAYMSEYSNRDLSFDSDSLDAFRGILKNSYSYPANAALGRLQSYFGLPLFGRSYKILVDSLRLALVSWHHSRNCSWLSRKSNTFKVEDKVANHTKSISDNPPRRLQPELPSWSCLGWRGFVNFELYGGRNSSLESIRMRQLGERGYRLLVSNAMVHTKWRATIQLRFKNGTIFDDRAFVEMDDDFSSTLSTHIWLVQSRKACFSRMRLVKPQIIDRTGTESSPTRIFTELHFDSEGGDSASDGSSPPEPARMQLDLSIACVDSEIEHLLQQLTQDVWKCVVICLHKSTIYCLVIKPQSVGSDGQCVWERVGMCHICWSEPEPQFSHPIPIKALPVEPYFPISSDGFCLG